MVKNQKQYVVWFGLVCMVMLCVVCVLCVLSVAIWGYHVVFVCLACMFDSSFDFTANVSISSSPLENVIIVLHCVVLCCVVLCCVVLCCVVFVVVLCCGCVVLWLCCVVLCCVVLCCVVLCCVVFVSECVM